MGIQCVGVGLVAASSVHFLFDSQTVTCGKGDFLARFNGSRCGAGTSGQSAAGCGLEAAVVDGVGNVTGCRQFTCVSCSWRGNFTVGHCQRGGGHCRFQLILGRTASAGDVARIPGFVGQSGYGTGIAVNCHWITAGSGAYGDAVSQLKANLVVFYSGNYVAITGIFNRLGQFNGVRCTVISRNLEAFFFQIMQLAAVDGFFTTCSNSTVSHVTQSHRFGRVSAHQVYFVARRAGRIA